MALSDLRVTYNGVGATLYATIKQATDYAVWNSSAFETWANADIANYDLALTDQGGDTYSVAFPTTIGAGDYLVDYYEMAGATPALTDLHLCGELVHWDGAALVDASTVSLSAYALTTLDGVKRHMGITASTYDTVLTEIINGVSAQIETITRATFKARDFRHRHNGEWQRKLVLRGRPIQHVNRVSYGSANAMTITYSGSAIRANAMVYADPESPDAGGVRLVSVSTAGTRTTNNLTFAGYPTLALLAAAVAGVSGWSATVLTNIPTDDLHVTGSEDAKSRTVTFTWPDQDENSYTLNQRAGILAFNYSPNVPFGGANSGWTDGYEPNARFPKQHQGLLVEYRAGWEEIPADVDMLAREMVKEMFFARTANTGVQSSSLGPYSVSFNKEQADRVTRQLAKYMDVEAFVGGGA